jgi:hypothetical protein
MNPGENTLDTTLAFLLLKTINQNADKTTLVGRYLINYVEMLTTPDSHNDVYAATAHRMFFANWVKQGRPTNDVDKLLRLADNDGHNTDSVDGMINVIPVALLTFASHAQQQQDQQQQDQQRALVGSTINALRRSQALPKYGVVLQELLSAILRSPHATPAERLRGAIEDTLPLLAKKTGLRLTVSELLRQPDPMTACYIESSFPALLVFAYKYAQDPVGCLLKSANAGGENVNRSAVLGALIGAAYGWDVLKTLRFEDGVSLVEGLVAAGDIETQVQNFLGLFPVKAKDELRL